jgi:hypothetical protein
MDDGAWPCVSASWSVLLLLAVAAAVTEGGREAEMAQSRAHTRSFVAISLLSPSSVSFGRFHWLRLNYDLPAHLQRNAGGGGFQVSVPHDRQARFSRRLPKLLRSDGQRANPNIPEGPASGERRGHVPSTAARQGRRLA